MADDTIDWGKQIAVAKKYLLNEKALIIFLILIAIIFSTFFRMYPDNLPVTEDWARDTYYNQIRNSVGQQIDQQYPNLPTAQKNQLINEELEKVIETQGPALESQIQQTSEYFKTRLQNDEGQTYLLAIDPYLWHSQARNLEEYGQQGDEVVDGENSFSLRNGREPRVTRASLHPFLIVQLHKIGSFFNSNFSLLRAAFLMPVILIGLAIIPAFFLGRKIAGNLGGFIAGMIIALNTALLGRTPAGFSDTDSYIILFPLLITWLFVEALTAGKTRDKIIYSGLSAVSFALFVNVWGNAWHIATILLGVAFIYFVWSIIRDKKIISKNWKKKQIINTSAVRTAMVVLSFLVISFLIRTIEMGFNGGIGLLKSITIGPLGALVVKGVATTDIWPNVLTTVAELNAGSWPQIISSLGGTFFFVVGIIGVILTFFLKTEDGGIEIRYAILLLIWFVGLSIASLISARFIALLAAPFAIAFGAAFGILWNKASEFFKKQETTGLIVKIAIIVIVAVIFITPITKAHEVAKYEVPSMNDAWYSSLEGIKADTEDGIITSWWDFGHWFVNVAQTRVTFDGGDQGRRIYWVGKSLMTDDLEENKAILKMLNCGQNTGYELILESTENKYKSAQLINTIIYEDKKDASKTLSEAGLSEEEIEGVLEKTHCEDYLDQYYIVSQDMIGKAGVWAHFGGWDFERANIYNIATRNDYATAMTKLEEDLGLDEEEASQLYFEATSLTDSRQVDTWISPWPGYVSANGGTCVEDNTSIKCPVGQVIGNQQNAQAVLQEVNVPKEDPAQVQMLVQTIQNGALVGQDSIQPLKVTIGDEYGFETYEPENPGFQYEVVIGKDQTGTYRIIIADPLIADSAFTKLFFFDGLGMAGYEKLSDVTTFNGQRIIVYKVNLE